MCSSDLSVSLPVGSYQVTFMNAAGSVVFPEYVIPIFEKAPSCSGYVTESNIVIVKPAISPGRCNELIENGGFDNGLSFWQSVSSTPQIVNGVLKTTTRTDPVQHMVTQWLDTSCLQVGDRYDLRLEYRLVDAAGMNVVACDAGGSYCPKVVLLVSDFDPATGTTLDSWADIGSTDGPYKTGSAMNTMSGNWIVTAPQVAAEKIRFNIHNGNGQFIIDNVMLTKVDRCLGQRIKNGNASTGTTVNWSGWGNPIGIAAPGADGTGYALKAYGRNSWVRGIYQELDISCIEAGNVFNVDLRVKMYDESTGVGLACTPSNDPTYMKCPLLRLRSLRNTVDYTYLVVQDPAMVWDASGWNRFSVNVTIPVSMGGAGLQQFLVVVAGGPVNSVLLVDDFTFRKVS